MQTIGANKIPLIHGKYRDLSCENIILTITPVKGEGIVVTEDGKTTIRDIEHFSSCELEYFNPFKDYLCKL